MNIISRILVLICSFLFSASSYAQLKQVPYDHVLTNEELIQLIDTKNPELKKIYDEFFEGNENIALEELTKYFKESLASSYFFNWKNFEERFKEYNTTYKNRQEYHQRKALEHMELYPATTAWKLPFKNLKNKNVSAYEFRHLARQHKASDIAFMYYYTNDLKYLNYIPEQAESLNNAFDKGFVENIADGNGAYEAYRAANRIYNWLFVNQCLLASNEYTWQQQLTMLKLFLHTGAKLYHHNTKYHEGNHQTRGLSALTMLSIIYKDVNGTDLWFIRAKEILEEHLEKEIYNDNFQFERSVHYHIADITNYLYPYQIAKINNVEMGEVWDIKIENLFNALVKLALPDKNAPVLQDDTDSPWAEFNEIGDIMALGTALFNKPEFKYFASKKISSKDYWYLNKEQLEGFEKIKQKKPTILSTEFPSTGYYIMRKGWNNNDLYLNISAGLTPEKPDHQHGDMLGLEAYAFGNMILPNYQVRYYLKDLEFFKNSWVKNVALVDSLPQGGNWTGNKGGSGFGKFKSLPVPKIISWSKHNEIDVFTGSHNAYMDIGVEYRRQVIFIKDGFWIVQDQFTSEKGKRKFQQVWQGHYTEELPSEHYRSVFPNGAGLDLIQLSDLPSAYKIASFRGKGNIVLESEKLQSFNYTTLLFPFKDFEDRIKEPESFNTLKLKGWTIEKQGKNTDAKLKLEKGNKLLLLSASFITKDDKELKVSNGSADLFIKFENNSWELLNCGFNKIEIIFNKKKEIIVPGENKILNW